MCDPNILQSTEARNEENGNFVIDLFEVGNCNYFMYSLCCPCCAIADSRNRLDGSSLTFNLFCVSLIPYRWLVRSVYGIGNRENYMEDIVCSLCCPCFVINQMYQTIITKGNISSDGGYEFNITTFSTDFGEVNWCDNLFCLLCLQPCSIGKVASHGIGMPYILACCFMNICFLRNVIRYHYRIKAQFERDEYDELFMPIGTFFGGLCFCNPVLSMAYTMSITSQVVEEIKYRPKATNKKYLLGYTVEIQNAALIEETLYPYSGYEVPNRFIRENQLNIIDTSNVENITDIKEYSTAHSGSVTWLTNEEILIAPQQSRSIIRTSSGTIKYSISVEDVELLDEL